MDEWELLLLAKKWALIIFVFEIGIALLCFAMRHSLFAWASVGATCSGMTYLWVRTMTDE